MIKRIGLLLVVLCGAGIGVMAAMQLGQKRMAAERMSQLLREWSVQMTFRCSSVQELLEQTQQETAYAAFGFPGVMLEQLGNGVPLCRAWQSGLEQERMLTEPLKDILLPLGDELGASDLEGQQKTLEQYRSRVTAYAQELRDKSASRQRLYSTLGVLGGLMAAILLA